MSNKKVMSLKEFFAIWLPLLGSWWMMAVEGPFLTSLTARLDNPKENLAAFGVAFSLAWLFEAPIVMMMTASLRLVKKQTEPNLPKKFNYTLCAIISLTFLIAVTPSGWQLLSKTILSLSDNISNIAWNANDCPSSLACSHWI